METRYALDMNNPRVEQALIELGIPRNELLVKTLEDFVEPRVEEEIAKLRFDFYERRLKDTVRKVKNEMRTLRKRPEQQTSSYRPTLNLGSEEQGSIEQLRQRYAKALKSSYKEQKAKFSSKSTRNLKSSQSTADEYTNPKTAKTLTHRERFLERSKKLKAEYEEQQETMRVVMLKSMAEHTAKEMKHRLSRIEKHRVKEEELAKRKENIDAMREDFDYASDLKARQMLSSLEMKLAKSEETHQNALKETAEKAAISNSKVAEVYESQRLQRSNFSHELLVMKHRKIEDARHRRTLNYKGKELDAKQKELKLQRHLEKLTFAKQQEELKIIELQKKIDADNNTLFKRNQAWQHELKLRKELQRLRYNDLHIKVQRARRIQSSKQFRTLQKHLEGVQRIDEFNTLKSRQANACRSRASQEMLERDKFFKARELLFKTDLARASSLLKDYELSSDESVAEDVKELKSR